MTVKQYRGIRSNVFVHDHYFEVSIRVLYYYLGQSFTISIIYFTPTHMVN